MNADSPTTEPVHIDVPEIPPLAPVAGNWRRLPPPPDMLAAVPWHHAGTQLGVFSTFGTLSGQLVYLLAITRDGGRRPSREQCALVLQQFACPQAAEVELPEQGPMRHFATRVPAASGGAT